MTENLHNKFEASQRLNLEKVKDEHIIKGKIKQRGIKRGQTTKFVGKLINGMPETELNIKCAIKKLKDLQVAITDLDAEIDSYIVSSNDWSEGEYDQECEAVEHYHDIINEFIIRLESELELPHSQSGRDSVSSNANTRPAKLQLPFVELPTFDGQPEMFEQFIESFEQSIANFKLSEFEKFSLLLKQVSGAARIIVDSVRPHEQTYSAAKSLLASAFSDETCQRFSVINKLINIRYNSVDDSFRWIGEARTVTAQIDRLKIDGNVFAQYFLWNSLPESVRAQFINITNSSKPDLDSILNSAFEVFTRIRDVPAVNREMETSNSRENTIALATDCSKARSEYPQKDSKDRISICNLCEYEGVTDSNHRNIDCPRFSTSELKLKVINKAGGCTRCGKLTHSLSACKYRFSGKCRNCNKYHAYFLCTAKRKNYAGNDKLVAHDQGGKHQKQNRSSTECLKPKPMTANLVQYNVMSATSNENIIIPTFTARVGNADKVRCMYDPAAQATFVSKHALEKLKYKVMEKIQINVSGFNSSRTIDTELVKLDMKLNNNPKPHTVHAIVVSDIKTRINANISDVVEGFKDAGVSLADRSLGTDGDERVDILFGVDYVHLLPVHCCSFGRGNLSAVYYTCQGVMLAGDVNNLRANLPYLGAVSKFITDFDKYFR